MDETGAAALGVRAVMRTDREAVRPDQPVGEVARALVEAGASGLPVLNEAGALVGIVSEYDVLGKRGATAGDIMSRGVISVGEDADAAEAARLMGLHGIRLLPVCRDGRLVGTVARGDLVRLFAAVSWVCVACGAEERGLAQPHGCTRCRGATFRLERER